MKLKELLKEVTLKRVAIDNDCYCSDGEAVTKITIDSFTEEGLSYWDDILSSNVVEIDGETIVIDCKKESRVQRFCAAINGRCSDENYIRWFTGDHWP